MCQLKHHAPSNRRLSMIFFRGKTAAHWQARKFPLNEVLWQLVCLNDRFALDGLSPPSYGGLLWCFGWGDNPVDGQKVSEKWAHRYRTGPEGFEQAKEIVLSSQVDSPEKSVMEWFPVAKKARSECGAPPKQQKSPSQPTTMLTYFSPVGRKQEDTTSKPDPHKTIG